MVRLHGLTKAVRCNYHLRLQLGPQAKSFPATLSKDRPEEASFEEEPGREKIQQDLRTPERDQVDRDMCGHV